MKLLKREWLQIVLLAVPFCAVALLWDKLPERIAIHWNIRGEIDGYASRVFGALFGPCMNVLLVALLAVLSWIDPRVRKQDAETRASSQRVFRGLRLTFSLFFMAISFAVLTIALGFPLDMSRFIGAGMALLFLVLGNLMGKIRPNYFVGVRTPWTLESRDVWQKTHRLAGRVMVAGSFLLLVSALTLPSRAVVLVLLPVVLIMTLVPVVYSYVIYRKVQPA
jgi:uncharacterized membrane protein